MKRTVTFCGREMTLESNALLPRQYRHMFGRDLIVDMKQMVREHKEGAEVINVEPLENITWLMFRAAGEDVGESVEDWLGSIDDSMAIYSIINDVVDLWMASQKTTALPKKK